MVPIFWDGVPPSGFNPLETPVRRVLPGDTQFFRFLGAVQGVQTHYDQELKKTFPCLLTGCRYCPDPAIRWKGYAAAQHWTLDRAPDVKGKKNGRWTRCILEVTAGMMGHLGEPQALRGAIYQCRRRTASKNSLVIAERVEQPPDPNLPPDFNVRPWLLYLWGYGRQPKKPLPPHIDQAPPGFEGGDQGEGQAQAEGGAS
jgi:hypothetical protein